jgi:hypothetical protein
MLYFNTIPRISTSDNNGNSIILTNLLKRVNIIPSLLKNPSLFYQYDIQEGDTPEIIAAKYYGDSYRYWLVLYANQILDPQWDWPLTSSQFDVYIKDKYAEAAAAANVSSVIAYTTGTVQQYTQTITTVDSTSLTQTSKTIVIDENTYNSITTGVTSQTFPSGAVVTQTVSKNATNIYDYELELNESKRTISLIKSIYVSEIESQFKSLMKA